MRLANIDNRGIASYILSLYFSIAVLSGDALGILENVEVGSYYDYKMSFTVIPQTRPCAIYSPAYTGAA